MRRYTTEYTENVSEKDTYTTNPSKLGNKAFPSLYFFRKLFYIIYYSNRDAKAGVYDGLKWYNSSIDIRERLEEAGVKMHFEGMDNIRKVEGPVVFVSNHMSTLETLILPGIIHGTKRCLFVTKKELTTYPLFGPINSAREPIIVSRENPREDLKQVMEMGSQKLKEGKSVVIFPQRTRQPKLDTEGFNSLGEKLAKKNNVPVIPIALLTDAWPNGKYIKEAAKLDTNKTAHFAFGEPMSIAGNGSDEHQKVIEFISSKFKEWGREDLIS